VQLAREQGAEIVQMYPDAADLRGAEPALLGELAARSGIVLHELSPQSGSLEDAFLELTRSSQEYSATAPPVMPTTAPTTMPTTAGGPLPPPPPPTAGPSPGGGPR
jgi:ABC-2 type transport system ATP-binding protein